MSHQNWVEGNIPLPSTSETYLNLLATLLLIQPSGFLCHGSVLVAHSQFYCPVEHPGPSLQGCFHAISGNVLHWLLHTIFLHMPMEINTEMRKKHHQVKHTILKAFTNPLGPLCHMQFLFLSQWKKKKKLSKLLSWTYFIWTQALCQHFAVLPEDRDGWGSFIFQ